MIAPARLAAYEALQAIATGRRDLDDAVEHARQRLRDARDLALLHDLVTGTVRWQSQLDYLLAPLSKTPVGRLDTEVLTTLRLAAYQLLHLTRVPASAVVNDAVALARAARKSSAAGMVNAVLRRLAAGERRPFPSRPSDAGDDGRSALVEYLSVVHAHPAWLVERWLSRETPEVVEAWLAFNNQQPPVALRANPLAVPTREALAEALAAQGISTTPCRFAPWGLIVASGSVVGAAALAAGAAIVQDEGSQIAGHVAPVAAGHAVLDVCGAPGGKALMYAALAGPAGRLVACDVRPRRVALLADTLRRGHAPRAVVVRINADAPLPFSQAFDVVTVDAPCSGLGTLRRDPDIKWRRDAAELERFAALQLDLLRRAAAVVRVGGVLVYTTCSSEREENAAVIERFLANAADFRVRPAHDGAGGEALAPLVGEDGFVTTHPVRHGLECYFGAVLERTAPPEGRAGAPQALVIQ